MFNVPYKDKQRKSRGENVHNNYTGPVTKERAVGMRVL